MAPGEVGFGFELLRQAHHPVEHGEKAQDAGLAPVALVQQPHEAALGLEAVVGCITRAQREQVADGDEREGVGVGGQGGELALAVDQLRHREAEAVAAAEKLEAKAVGAPVRVVVTENGEARNGAVVAVEDAVVVDEHAAREGAVVPALDLDVDADPVLAAVVREDADELVDMATAEFGIAHDLLQLLVEEGMAARPVYPAGGVGEVEGDEFGEGLLEGLFPGVVAVVGGGHGSAPGAAEWILIWNTPSALNGELHPALRDDDKGGNVSPITMRTQNCGTSDTARQNATKASAFRKVRRLSSTEQKPSISQNLPSQVTELFGAVSANLTLLKQDPTDP